MFLKFCRRVAALLALSMLSMVSGSCGGPNLVPIATGEIPTVSTGIAITIQSTSSRAVLVPEQSSILANTWEVIILQNEIIVFTTALEAGSNSIVALEPGLYDLVVLAGYRKSSSSSTTSLLGSASTDNQVQVIAGAVSTVSLALKAIDFEFAVPSQVDQGSQLSLSVSGQSRNYRLGMCLTGSTSERPRLRSSYLWNGYQDFISVSGSPSDWVATTSLALNKPAGIADLDFNGAYISLCNSGAADGSLYQRTRYIWKWLNRYDMADDGPLTSLVSRQIQINPPSTGVNIGIGWE